VDGGLIPQKGRDSLAKGAAEAVCFNLDPRIGSVRPRLESTLEGVRDDLSLWIEIGRSGTDLGLQLARSTGFELDG
jgi:hypothetical protein